MMHFHPRCALAAATAAFAFMASAALAQPFFATPPRGAHEPMFISIYSVLPEQNGRDNMERIAAARFTAAGPYYNADGQPTGAGAAFYARVNEADSHLLNFVAHMPMHPAVVDNVEGEARPDSMAAIAEGDLRAHVRTIADYTLHDVQTNARVRAWFVLPEELRPWKTGEMSYLQVVADELHRYDPQRRPVTMYNPNHRSPEELATVVSQGLDWTMMGVYSFDVRLDARGARMGEGLDRLIAGATATDTRPVAVYQLSQDFPAADLQALRASLGGVDQAEAIRQLVRHDVYQGLARGIGGIQIWSGCDCRPGLTTFSEQLDAYASASADLNGNLNLADVFLQGERRNDLKATVQAGPATVAFENHVVDTLTLADIAYDGRRYVFVVNSANAAVTAKITGLPPGAAQVAKLFESSPAFQVDANAGAITATMKPFDVLALRIDAILNADANGDRQVNGIDFVAWQRNVGRGVAGPPGGDFNHDGRVNHADLLVWHAQSQASHTATLVPEPAFFACVGLGPLWLVGRQRVSPATRSK